MPLHKHPRHFFGDLRFCLFFGQHVTRLAHIFAPFGGVSQIYIAFFPHQVVAVQEEANRLQGSYAGDKAREIQAKEDEVVDAWKRLNWRVKQRTERLHDADDLYRFLLAVQDQMLWMNDMLKQILTYEKAK